MKVLIHSAVVALFVASAAQAQEAVQWKVSNGGNGHWYRDLGTSGTVAAIPALLSEIARDAGGHLVSYHSAAEEQFVIQSVGAGMVGLFGVAGSAAFVWSSGEPVTYSNWGCCGCNNAPYPNNSNQSDRIVFQANYPGCTGTQGFGPPWDDYLLSNWGSGIERNFVVIEWSADCNGDGIVDYGQCRDGSLPDYDGNNVPDCCEAGTPCVVGSYPVQWPVSSGGNGHWYRLVIPEVRMSQPSAAAMAMAAGGHLASMSSASENQRTFEIAAADPPRWVPAWAGASQITGPWIGATYQGGQWKWSDGTPWSFTSWLPSEPNHLSFETAVLFGSPVGTGPSNRWNNIDPAYQNWGFLVEWSADCNGDGAVDFGQILRGQLVDLNLDGVPDDCQQPTCVDADIYRDFNVNGADLGILLAQWGTITPRTESDLNADGAVDGVDLGVLLSFWGPCP